MRNCHTLLLATMLVGPSAARAQTSEVGTLLREGVALRLAGHDDTALVRFVEAHARCHCAEARAQMGLAAQALGRFASAEAWLAEAIAARGDRWVDANRTELEAALAAVSARAATLLVHAEVGASVRVDGEERGDVDASGVLPVRVDAGRHRVSLAARDGREAADTVEVIAGGESALRVVLPPPAVPAAPALGGIRGPTERPSIWRRAAPWVAVAGAASVVGGGVAFVFERRYTAVWQSPDCLSGNRTREENCGPWRVSAERAEEATLTSWAVGGALLAAAAGLWWLAPRTTRHVALGCGPTGGPGVVCGGRF